MNMITRWSYLEERLFALDPNPFQSIKSSSAERTSWEFKIIWKLRYAASNLVKWEILFPSIFLVFLDLVKVYLLMLSMELFVLQDWGGGVGGKSGIYSWCTGKAIYSPLILIMPLIIFSKIFKLYCQIRYHITL